MMRTLLLGSLYVFWCLFSLCGADLKDDYPQRRAIVQIGEIIISLRII